MPNGVINGDLHIAGVTLDNNTGLKSQINPGDTALLEAYDTFNLIYTPFATLTSNDPPTFDLNPATTIGGSPIGAIAIFGDTGAISGSTFTIYSNQAGTNSGATVAFVNSGTTSTLNMSDNNSNTFVGNSVGNTTLSGAGNASLGTSNLSSITSGTQNNAFARGVLNSLQDGSDNCGYGNGSLNATVSDLQNCGYGSTTLSSLNGSGSSIGNCAFGFNSMPILETGSYNFAGGHSSGNAYNTSESSNIVINANGTAGESNVLRLGNGTGTGTQHINKSIICGINGVVVSGVPVLVSSGDQLGVAASTLRLKDNIKDMRDSSASIMNLRPVSFNWNKNAPKDSPKETQYGLIAEEVHEIFPYLCVYDKEGKPFSVKYHELPAILLNEIQRMNKKIEDLTKKLESK